MFIITLAIVFYVILGHFTELKTLRELIKDLHVGWLLLVLLAEAGTHVFGALVYKALLKTQGQKVSLWKLVQWYLGLTFMYHVIPASGLTGPLYFTTMLSRQGVPKGAGLAASIMSAFTSYVGFFMLLVFSFFYLLFAHTQNTFSPVQLAIVTGGMAAFFFLLDRLIVHHLWLHKVLNRFATRTKIHRLKTFLVRTEEFMDELAEARNQYAKHKSSFFLPTLFQIGIVLCDALSIWFLFIDLHYSISYVLCLVVVNVARLLGSISILPGGVGTYEAAMIIAFRTLGMELTLATTVTSLFRLFSYWLPIPIGFIFYQRSFKNIQIPE